MGGAPKVVGLSWARLNATPMVAEPTSAIKKQSHDHCVGGPLKTKVQGVGRAAETYHGEEALFFCAFLAARTLMFARRNSIIPHSRTFCQVENLHKIKPVKSRNFVQKFSRFYLTFLGVGCIIIIERDEASGSEEVSRGLGHLDKGVSF